MHSNLRGERRQERRGKLRAATFAGLAASALTLTGLASNAQAAADVNFATNGGFESGLTGWTCDADSQAAIVSSPVHGGSGAVTVKPSDTYYGQSATCKQTVAVTPSRYYAVQGWFKGGEISLGFTGSGFGTGSAATDTEGTTGGAWVELGIPFYTGPSTTSVTIYFSGWYSEPAYFADDISVTGGGTLP
jgi:hypothetical protein